MFRRIFSHIEYKDINLIQKRLFNRSNVVRWTEEKSINNNESTIIVEKDTNITLIGINREHTRNSIDATTAELLSHVIRDFENDDTSPVAVLYGVGGTISTGHDLKELEHGHFDHLFKAEGSVGPTRRHLRKPIVCGINGFCVASGIELALLCDLRVMEDTAVIGFFNRRLGVPICDGGTARLSAIIGYSRAVDLIVTGRRINAQEALKIGLVNRVVATGTALGQAVHLAFSLAKFPLAALQHDRKTIYENVFERKGVHSAMQNEIMNISAETLKEMYEQMLRFKEAKVSQTNWKYIKAKALPKWEQEEIAHEERWAKENTARKIYSCDE